MSAIDLLRTESKLLMIMNDV